MLQISFSLFFFYFFLPFFLSFFFLLIYVIIRVGVFMEVGGACYYFWLSSGVSQHQLLSRCTHTTVRVYSLVWQFFSLHSDIVITKIVEVLIILVVLKRKLNLWLLEQTALHVKSLILMQCLFFISVFGCCLSSQSSGALVDLANTLTAFL